MSKENIILQNTISMTSRQVTFALALSRDMAPEARIVVFTRIGRGEVLADSLQFHVHDDVSEEVPALSQKAMYRICYDGARRFSDFS